MEISKAEINSAAAAAANKPSGTPIELRGAEILVKAMQASDTHGIATPEGWQPGDKVIVPTPQDVDAAEKRMNEGYECTDWYFCKKVA
jgi:hypothetical protein